MYNLRRQIDELLSDNENSQVKVDEMISRNSTDEELIQINDEYATLTDFLEEQARFDAMLQRDNLLLAVCSSECSRLQEFVSF